MKKRFTLIVAFLLFTALNIVNAQTLSSDSQDGKVYFKIKNGLPSNINATEGIADISKVVFLKNIIDKYQIISCICPFYKQKDDQLQRTWLVTFNNYELADQLIQEITSNPEIEYAEKVPIFKLFLTPNDTYYGNVSGFLGTVNAKWHLDVIEAGAAWDLNQGSGNVKVAVLDNAIWINHPDLVNKVVNAIDIADNDNDPTPPTADLTWSHGTHTAGLIGAQSNNGTGVASIGYNTSLIAVKVARNSDGALVAGYEGIIWAADNDADVISMSWGTTQYYQTMQNIINYAYNKGCVLVAAAGNDGNDTIQYPAGLDHVISVGSTDESDQVSSFSCYGTWIDVCAPGGSASGGSGLFSVLSTTYSDASYLGAALFGVSGKYDVMAGTSMSCPVTAGLCGLLLAVDSTMTPDKLENILKLGCDNIDAENSGLIGLMGAGRINAFHSIQIAQDSAKTLVADFTANETVIMVGGGINFTDLSTGNPTSWSWLFPGGTPASSSDTNPVNIIYNNPGIYPVTLTVSDGANFNTETKTSLIIVKMLPSSVWIPQATAFTSQYRGIRTISIADPNVVWASAYDGSGQGATVLDFARTWDGGNTWAPGTITGVPSGLDISELFAVNKDTAWAALWGNTTGGNGIFRTNDGGLTWAAQPTALFSGSSAFPNTVYFWDENNGLCMGDPNGGYFEFYTTSDGGETWIRVPQANIPAPASGEYSYNGGKDYDVVGNTIWFGTNKGNVFKSTDRGLNWTSVATGLTEVSNVAFSDENNGVIEYKVFNTSTGEITTFMMKRTSDGGATWQTLTPAGAIFKSDISAVPGKSGMYVSTGISQNLPSNGSSYSLDYGLNWTMIDDSVQYTCVKFYDLNTGWAGGFNQSVTSEGIWKWMGLIQDSITIIPEFMADYTNINVGDTVNFTDLSLGTIDAWQWTFDGGTPVNSSDQNPTEIIYNTAGNYTVTLNCNNTDTLVTKTKTAYIHVSDNSSINKHENENVLTIYPNPANNLLYIALNSTNVAVAIYDVTGKTIWNGINDSERTVVINVENWEKGIYFVEVRTDNTVKREKIIKL
mgnify:CR=1 FL=1